MELDSFKFKDHIYKTLIERFPDIVIILNLNLEIIDISNRFLMLYELESKKQIIGKNILQLISPEDKEYAKENWKKMRKDGFLKMVEFRLLNKDGTKFIGELSLSAVIEKDQKPSYFIGILRNITNQKKLEEDLRKSQQMFQTNNSCSINLIPINFGFGTSSAKITCCGISSFISITQTTTTGTR